MHGRLLLADDVVSENRNSQTLFKPVLIQAALTKIMQVTLNKHSLDLTWGTGVCSHCARNG